MPGIAAIISKRPDHEFEGLVRSMVSSMKHESFYNSGTYSVPEMGIFVGWIAHENPFADRQPFFNEQRDVVLIIAGECFADSGILTDLRQKGHKLGQAAGGWLVHLYEEEGDRFFEKEILEKFKIVFIFLKYPE